MMKINELLKNKPLFFDGGMGTSLQKKGLKAGEAPEKMLLTNREIVTEVHKKFISAGSNIIETNTFGGNRKRLIHSQLENKVKDVNQIAAEIALQAAEGKALVAGSVGPLGELIQPYGELSKEEALEVYFEQINTLIISGINIILIETMISLEEAIIAIKAAKECKAKIIGVTFTFEKGVDNFYTSFGETIDVIVEKMEIINVDFTGSNCGYGFEDILEIGKKFKVVTDLPILLQPNAGLPEYRNGEMFYPESPNQFSSFTKKANDLGIAFIGGCCGTTDEHIREGIKGLKQIQ